MRRSLLAAVCCTLFSATSIQAQQAPASGLVSPAQTVRFNEVAIADGTAVTNQFAAYGVSFNGLYMSFANYLGGGPMLANFLPGNICPPGGCHSPVTITFSQAVQGAAFRALWNPGFSLFEAHLNGAVVGTFSTNATSTSTYHGFTGPLDMIRVYPGGVNRGFDMDDLQIGAPAQVTPEPVSMILLGSGLAGIAAARRRRKNKPVI